jgi:hypothetical protein
MKKTTIKNKDKPFACVIKQYGTGLYRACITLGENNLIHLGTHQNAASANEAMNRFLEAEQNGEMKTPEDILAFIDSINLYVGDPVPMGDPMPMEDFVPMEDLVLANDEPPLAVAA